MFRVFPASTAHWAVSYSCALICSPLPLHFRFRVAASAPPAVEQQAERGQGQA